MFIETGFIGSVTKNFKLNFEKSRIVCLNMGNKLIKAFTLTGRKISERHKDF